ncbi:hypothetical protein C8R48DRAFT_663359 [Suillus tomentosus]|nr:hypothetical protein C8R48DRAFT_663359 [Suillus tomentosus]
MARQVWKITTHSRNAWTHDKLKVGYDTNATILRLLQQILDTLRSSNIVEKGANDERSRLWTVYQKVASQHDNEFLEQYDGDMDIVLIFASHT